MLDTFYVPSISRYLISLSKLNVDGLYKLNLDNLYAETLMTLHHNVGTKRGLVNECSAYLWHKRLGHISKERLERLVKNEILPNLDFTDLNVYVDCIKDK